MRNDLQEYLDFLEQDKYKDVDKSKSIPNEGLDIFKETPKTQQDYGVPKSYVEYSKNPTPLYSSAKKSLSELEADPEFDIRATRFLEGIGRNENIFEYLRDSDYSLSSAAQRSFEVGKWTEEQKQDYLYLREQFDNAELKGFKERLNFVKDFAVDVVADPLNIVAALFAIPTMGGSVGAKTAATAVANQGIKQLIKSSLKSAKKPAIFGAAEGMAWAGPHEYFLQSTDVGLGARDEIDMSLVAGTAALGGVIGGVGVGGLGAINAGRYLSKEFKYSNEEAIIKEGKKKTRKQIQEEEQINSVSEKKDTVISTLIGKPTTAFIQKAKKSATLTDLLDKFRYDWDVSVFGKKDVKVRKDSYGMALGKRQGEYLSGMNRSLNPLNKVRRSWYDWSGKLEVKQNDQLAYLLRGGKSKEFNGKPIDDEVFDAYKEIKQLLDNVFNEGNKVGLFSPFQRVTAYMPRKFKYEAIENNYDDFVDLIKKSGHADPLDEIPQVRVITEENKTIVARLEGQNGIDAEAFGFEGNIKSFKELARKELGIDINDTTTRADEVLEKAKELKAERIVTDMLEYRWTPFELRSSLKAGNGSSFIQHRAFKNIDDNALAPYLENDVELVLQDYFTNVSQAIERTRFFGKSVEDFKNNYLKNEAKQTGIYYELINNGVSKADARDTIKKLAVMHGRVTGLDVPSIKSPTLQSLSDWGRLSQQMAHLPFATVSSITEPFILLSRVGVEDAPAAVRDIGKALVAETKKTGQRISQGIRRGLGGKTKNLKDLDDETWSEVYQTGLALEQAVQERIEGLTGEAIKGTVARSLQNTFFKTNLLTQWTSAVQLAAFTTGKRLIVRNAERLSKGGLNKEQKEYLTEQLNDLGIDADEAVRFYNKSLDKKGNYSGVLAKQQDFYDTRLLSGANRFTKEIILNPSTAEANRPLWFSTPAAQVLVQFAGYPTVFNNTILKRFASEISNDSRKAIAGIREGRISPLIGQATPKILGTTMLMTGVAMLGNYIRSPQYFDTKFDGTFKSEGEIIMDSIQRWGGFGPFDYAARFTDADEAGAGDLGSLLKAVSGPLPQDAIDSILYRKGIPEIIGTNLPFYSAYDLIFGEGTKKELRANLRALSKGKPKEKSKSSYLPAYSKGGIVKNVPNVKDEPDEMQSRVTGVPFNSTADFMKDEEDRELESQMEGLGLRKPYVVGGVAKALTKTIDNASSKRGQKLRKSYLDRKHLEKLDETVDERFVSLTMIKDLLENKDITVTEAVNYLKAGGYKKSVINKFIRPYKEIGL